MSDRTRAIIHLFPVSWAAIAISIAFCGHGTGWVCSPGGATDGCWGLAGVQIGRTLHAPLMPATNVRHERDKANMTVYSGLCQPRQDD
jgi:hypothetical protein